MIMKRIKKVEEEFKPIIPANVDPIKLADKIKGDLTGKWLESIKRIRARRFKSLRVKQSQ